MTPEENQRLEAIERRLARLEALLAPPAMEQRAQAPPAAEQPKPPPALVAPTSRPPAAGIETRFGLTWISRIGVVTVILALAFFFEYAFENHWITEWGRVALGLGCGVLSLFFGERFWRGAQATFAQALTAAGIAFFYLSFWAAFALYQLMPQAAAFGLMLLTTAAAGALALRYNGPAIAALSLAGGFATPLLLGSEKDPWFVLLYALLLDLGAALAARARRWNWLEAVAILGSVVLYASQMEFPPAPGMRLVYTFFACAFYLVFVFSALPPVFGAAQILAGLALVQVWAPGAGVLALVLAIAVAGLAVANWRGWPTAVSAAFAGFWAAYGFWTLQAPGTRPFTALLGLLTAAFVAFLAWPLWRAARRRRSLRLQDLIVLALNAAFYFGACYGLLESSGHAAWAGLFAVGVAVAVMALAARLHKYDERGAALAAGVAWALLVLAAPIQFAGYRVTVAWALEAAALAWVGSRMAERRALYGSAAIFALALARLAWIDSRMYASPSEYGALVNARFLAFAASAAGLWLAAWWVRRGRYAAAAYLAGHAILLWGLCLEAVGWADRIAAPENARSVASTSISVLVAIYAVLLVAGGVYRRHAPTRVLGIGLIGFIVLKLYLYDVWLLGEFYRMAAFAILGVLLLVMSYFYSRFRGSMENWWRP